MKKISKKKTMLLMSVGTLVIGASQIIAHYMQPNDLTKGFFWGIGIGLLLTALIFGKFKTVQL